MEKSIYTLYSDKLKRIVFTLWRDKISDGFTDADGYVRIFSVTGGSGSITFDGITESFSEGDTFIFDNQKSFSVSDCRDTEAFLLKFNLSNFVDAEYSVISKNNMSDFQSRIGSSGEKLSGIHLNTKKIQDALYMIENEFENENSGSYGVIRAYVILILSLAIQYMFAEPDGVAVNKTTYYKSIKKSLVYINEHLSEKLTLDDLAKSANMGKTNFSVAFKRVTGMTVWDYILNSRIEFAANYLVEKGDDLNITEIAMISGFNNVAHFTKTFKRIKGNTPREFKKNPQNPCF